MKQRAKRDTIADHERFATLYKQWQDRDFDANNFELHAMLLNMCERFGWEIPEDLR